VGEKEKRQRRKIRKKVVGEKEKAGRKIQALSLSGTRASISTRALISTGLKGGLKGGTGLTGFFLSSVISLT
jgi:hypothetical protein